MSVNTRSVTGRRTLAYQSYAELLADAEHAAEGPTRLLGNWSAGQIFRHLARAYNGSIDGLPGTFPFWMRVMAGFFKSRLINGAMPAGLKPPRDLAEAVIPPATSTEDGLAELREAIARLEKEPNRARHPVFGQLSREEWDRLNLNHAALHMSFLVPA